MRSTLAAAAASLFAAACLAPDDHNAGYFPVRLPEATQEGAARRPNAPPIRRAAEVSGGTITTVGPDLVAVSDADTDSIYLLRVFPAQNPYLHATVPLPERSQPARAAMGEGGVLYVALRGTGEIARIDTVAGRLISLTFACAEPRGVTWDTVNRLARVACANGLLATVDEEGRVATERWPADLRDVVVKSDGTLEGIVFRTGQTVTRTGATVRSLPQVSVVTDSDTRATFVPNVAWRTLTAPDGSLVTVHQRAVEGAVSNIFSKPVVTTTTTTTVVSSSYSGPRTTTTTTVAPACATPVIRSAVTVVREGSADIISTELPGVLPVDAAVSNEGELAVAFAGTKAVVRRPLPYETALMGEQCASKEVTTGVGGIPSGVTYLADGTLVVHTVSPSRVVVLSKARPQQSVVLAAPLAGGMALFYGAVNGVACASCHPEGRDDGHVWQVGATRRRTPSLLGGLLDTAPFHWEGEHATLSNVMADTFVQRMGGVMPTEPDIREMAQWLHYLPGSTQLMHGSPKEQLARGKALFEGPQANCVACHTGPTLTDNLTRDVGTGGKFQTPSLRGVGSRGPWLHDGRAATLAERFLPNGGGDRHGGVSQLSRDEVDALAAYLDTL